MHEAGKVNGKLLFLCSVGNMGWKEVHVLKLF